MYDPIFKMKFTPPSFPFLTGFEPFKLRLVHFLGGYILSLGNPKKGEGGNNPFKSLSGI